MTRAQRAGPRASNVICIEDIRIARVRIHGGVMTTLCPRSERLSRRTDSEVFLKLENAQLTGSFKERGALNRLLQLTAAEREHGVIAASAGNHAQGVALHAQRQCVDATIVMPTTTALVKVSATRDYGARVILHGDSYDEAAREAERLRQERDLTLVHAFDDDAVIAGQGTIGLEILEQVPDVDAVVAPIGGGGLAGGIALAIKESNPTVKVFGVETQLVPSMQQALLHGAAHVMPARRSIADGISTRRVCGRTLALAQRYLDGIVSVEEGEIAEAILRLLEDEKTVAEGAGAVGLAALLSRRLQLQGKRVVLVVSGGNIDVNLLSRIIERGLANSGRTMRVRVLIPDVPGTLASLLTTIAQTGANVLSVQHDRVAPRAPISSTVVDIALETRGLDHIRNVEAALRDAGWHIEV